MSALRSIGPGHNNPPEPTPIERAKDAMTALSAFLNETPVITEGQHLVEAKRLVDHARGAMFEMEAERVFLVRPLNQQVDEINARFKSIHNTDSKKPGTFDKIFNELKARLTSYAVEEEGRRERAAAEALANLARAEAVAREAEQIERQAKMDAVMGVIDTGIAEAIADADQRYLEFQQATRFAARAERDVTLRIGDGHGRSLSMRTEKTLVLDSYSKAIKAIGPNDTIKEAILTAAHAYRKQHGRLPDGVSETTERKF